MERHAPIGNVGVIERGLERFVFDQQSLLGPQIVVHGPKVLFEPPFSLPDIRSAWVIGSVGEPHRDIPALEVPADLDPFTHVLHRTLADFFLRIRERTVLVFLVLKKVGVDGAGFYAIATGIPPDLGNVLRALGTVPENMQCHGGTDPGKKTHLPGIAEFFLNGCSRSGLDELAETRPGIRKSPGWHLDTKCFQGAKNAVRLLGIHRPDLWFPDSLHYTRQHVYFP